VHRYLEIKNEILYEAAKEITEKIIKRFMKRIKTIAPNDKYIVI